MKLKKRKKNNFLNIFIILITITLCSSFSSVFCQKRYMLNEKESKRFKLAKQLYYKGEQLFKKKNLDKAEKALKECLKKFPKYSHAYYFLSQIYYNKKDYQYAQKQIQLAKDNYKFVANIYISAQLEYYDLLRKQKEELELLVLELKESLSRTQSVPDIRQIENDINEKSNTIKIINDKLIVPIPENVDTPADYFYVHGNIYFKLKEYNQALNQYTHTIKKNPRHGNAYNNLANLYYMAKKYDKAMFYLGKAESNGVKINQKFKKELKIILEKN